MAKTISAESIHHQANSIGKRCQEGCAGPWEVVRPIGIITSVNDVLEINCEVTAVTEEIPTNTACGQRC